MWKLQQHVGSAEDGPTSVVNNSEVMHDRQACAYNTWILGLLATGFPGKAATDHDRET